MKAPHATSSNTYVGSPIERVEDLRFLRGRGQYIDDIRREGQVYAAFVRSPIAHGCLRGVDAAAALGMPGVRAVLTAADFDGAIPTIPFRRPNPTIGPYAQPVIARDKVRYVGEPAAVVLADSAELAEDAAQEVVLDIEELPAVVEISAAETSSAVLFEAMGTNLASVFEATLGDAAAAFAAADHIVAGQFKTQRQTAMPMETRGLLAEWDAAASHLTMSGAAKLPFFNRRSMAAMMGLHETQVDYIELDVGGGFGARGEFYPEDFLLAFAARKFGWPVKWIEDRREHFLATGHARESACKIEFAFRRDGTILGARGTLSGNIGAYVRPNGMTPIRNMVQFLSGPYRIPNIHFEGRALVTNKTPAGTYRGPGRYEGCLYCEQMLDLAAEQLGLDRLEIRRRNLLTSAEMPYELATVSPSDGAAQTYCDSGDYRTTFEHCVVESRWAEKIHLQGQLIDGRYHGLGIGNFIEGGASGPQENARITIEAGGTVVVYVGSSAIGQGVETVFAQIAADALELPLECIKVMHGSTTYLEEGWGSYGSRGTVMGGSAVQAAAAGLLDAFRSAAAARLGVSVDDLQVTNGEAHAPDGRVSTLAQMEGFSCDGAFKNSKATYTFGAAMAHVAVDPKTGHVEVIDYIVVDDVGRVINPLTLHGQVMGAAVQGFGSVFSEELAYDEAGQILVGSLADYRVPLATDYPNIRCVSLENFPSPNNPLGAKGAGEGGIIPVGAVVLNAVSAALKPLGVRPCELPISPPKLWELIQQAKINNMLRET